MMRIEIERQQPSRKNKLELSEGVPRQRNKRRDRHYERVFWKLFLVDVEHLQDAEVCGEHRGCRSGTKETVVPSVPPAGGTNAPN